MTVDPSWIAFFQTKEFILGVFAGGLVVNYASRIIDFTALRGWRIFKKGSERRQRIEEATVRMLTASDAYRTLLFHRAMLHYALGFLFMLWGVSITILSTLSVNPDNPFFTVGAGLSLLIGFGSSCVGYESARVLNRANRKLTKELQEHVRTAIVRDDP